LKIFKIFEAQFFFSNNRELHRVNGELLTCFYKLELSFSFFPFIEKLSLLFALPCPPVCKPEAVGRGIAIRAKVEQKRRVIFLYREKNEKLNSSLSKQVNISLCRQQFFLPRFKGNSTIFVL
jgi:hypothetical protein